MNASDMKPLFIPLRKKHFEAFERGDKTIERRKLGPRWNDKTCPVGRPVVLSCGYGKARRLTGAITSKTISRPDAKRADFVEIYGSNVPFAICIGIKLQPATKANGNE